MRPKRVSFMARSWKQSYYEPEEVLQDVQDKVNQAKAAGESIDYLTFVLDAEVEGVTGQDIEVVGYVGGDELNSLLN